MLSYQILTASQCLGSKEGILMFVLNRCKYKTYICCKNCPFFGIYVRSSMLQVMILGKIDCCSHVLHSYRCVTKKIKLFENVIFIKVQYHSSHFQTNRTAISVLCMFAFIHVLLCSVYVGFYDCHICIRLLNAHKICTQRVRFSCQGACRYFKKKNKGIHTLDWQ